MRYFGSNALGKHVCNRTCLDLENALENTKFNDKNKVEDDIDAKQQYDKNLLEVKASKVDKEKESRNSRCDIYEEEKPKSRRSRRKV